jgi:hypothetical protein
LQQSAGLSADLVERTAVGVFSHWGCTANYSNGRGVAMKKASGLCLLLAAVFSVPAVLADSNSDTGIAAGSTANASSAAAGSTTTAIVAGVVTAAVIGGVIAGTSDNKGSSTTSTTSTH